jgi:hypothetical protein
VYSKAARFVRCGCDDTSSFRGAADDEEGMRARALGVLETRDLDEESVAIYEKDAAMRVGRWCLKGNADVHDSLSEDGRCCWT